MLHEQKIPFLEKEFKQKNQLYNYFIDLTSEKRIDQF